MEGWRERSGVRCLAKNDQLRRNISGPDHYKTMIYREIKTTEYDLLKDFLYEAIFIPEGVAPPDRSIIYQPELSLYYEGFGSGRADHCIVAEEYIMVREL